MIHVNAYHQPGVEAGKKAAAEILGLQGRALAKLREDAAREWHPDALAEALGVADGGDLLFKILEHAAANPDHGVQALRGSGPGETRYRATS